MGRYLGQHFLINKNKLRKIVETLELKPSDTVIEIGPGHGELTQLIISNFPAEGEARQRRQFPITNFRIIAIEKDKNLVQILQKKFASDKNIKIIESDALKILPELCFKFQVSGFKIVGNIPYYITGYLLRILGELKNKPSLIVLTIQKEVAQRICVQPFGGAQGRPRMNLLAASVQFWAEPEIIGYISKKDFRPAPKVNSAIIKLIPNNITLGLRSQIKCNKERYYRFIKILFKQPRKTILNNLISNFQFPISKDEIAKKLKSIGINPNDRPQNLSIEQILELSTLF